MQTTAEQARRKLRNATTVQDLIDELSHMDPTALVVVQSNYGDHCRTQQLTAVENVDEFDPESMRVYETAYSNSGLAIDEREYGDEGDEHLTPEEQAEAGKAAEQELEDIKGLAMVILNLNN